VRRVADYTAAMAEKMAAMVGEALARLAPARLRVGKGRATFAVNRRNNREADVPALLAAGRPPGRAGGPAVPVSTVARADRGPAGSLEAIVFGSACHPTPLNFTSWCGDYPGFAQLDLERAHPGASAMFVNTCGGDQNPLPRRSVELCRRYGRSLADAVQDALKGPLRPVNPTLRSAFTYVDLPYLKVVDRGDLTAPARHANPVRAPWAARLLRQLDAGAVFPPSYPYPVHAWRLGDDTLFIGLGAEAVVDYALRFKREFGPGTWVCGYADDMISYIPSRRVWEE